MKGQNVANFIVEYRIDLKHDLDVDYVTITPWRLYFDGSVCKEGQGVGVVLVSPHDAYFEFSNQLEYDCTNNQTKFESLLFGLEMLESMGLNM